MTGGTLTPEAPSSTPETGGAISLDALKAAFRGAAVEAAHVPPRKAVSQAEAAAMISRSVDYFRDRVQPELRVIRDGRAVLIPVSEIDRWLDEKAERALPSERPVP